MEFKPTFHSGLYFKDDGGLPFTLTRQLTYVTNVKNFGTLVVPAGFKTDLASIPRFFWRILPPFGKYDKAAVVHDFLYQVAPFDFTRKQADDVLFEACGVLGVSRAQCNTIYAGVRVGGWKPWNEYRARG